MSVTVKYPQVSTLDCNSFLDRNLTSMNTHESHDSRSGCLTQTSLKLFGARSFTLSRFLQ